jgi:hypothetical protein
MPGSSTADAPHHTFYHRDLVVSNAQRHGVHRVVESGARRNQVKSAHAFVGTPPHLGLERDMRYLRRDLYLEPPPWNGINLLRIQHAHDKFRHGHCWQFAIYTIVFYAYGGFEGLACARIRSLAHLCDCSIVSREEKLSGFSVDSMRTWKLSGFSVDSMQSWEAERLPCGQHANLEAKRVLIMTSQWYGLIWRLGIPVCEVPSGRVGIPLCSRTPAGTSCTVSLCAVSVLLSSLVRV